MYLKSIAIKGFKSFPDRCRLEFAPGVSVIVGPNGSGKSNITDAVLWALGEQSPAAVRGQSMQDVIFGGAPGRQAAPAAEVEIVLDDSEGALGLGRPEISLQRRLDRSGEGEYRLSGARCRLVDVIEVLSDTGLGKEMHSVISQGRVEWIVTSKPRDRRMLIEEAAGLGKHRKRRRRAQLKLERTQDNLDRALDVEREARSRLRPLKRQAEAAELHRRLERQAREASWELARDELRRRLEELSQTEAAAGEARAAQAKLQGELSAVAERRQAAEETLASRSAQREELSRRSYAARGAGERVGYRAEAVHAAARTVRERLARAERTLEALRAEAEQDSGDEAAAGRIAELERELAALERDREAELARQLVALQEERAAAARAGEEAERSAGLREEERRAAEAAVERALDAVRKADRLLSAARADSARVGSELAAVNQFLRHHSRAPGGVPALADQLDVEPGLELALAAALDGRLGAAVVADRQAAARLLDGAGAEGGRVLVAAGGLSPPPLGVAPAGGRRLADQIRGDGAAADLARVLLRDVWVVEDLAALPADFDGAAVTAAGRVWSARTRELRQAPAVGEERVLSERNRRERLIAATEQALQSEHGARMRVEAARAEMTEAQSAADEAIGAHRAAVAAQDEARELERRLASAIERRRAAPDDGPQAGRRAQLSAQLAAERRLQERACAERAERRRRIGRLQARLEGDRELLPAIDAVSSALLAVAEGIAARRTIFDQQLVADRHEGEHVADELRECARREAELQAGLQRAGEALTAAEVAHQRAVDRAEDARAECRRLAALLELPADPSPDALDEDERQGLSDRLARLERRREQLGPVNPLAAQEYEEALAHVEELERQRTDLEAAMRELEKLIADTDRQIRTIFEETFAATARGFEELVGELFPGGSGRLRLVSERTGPARVLGGEDAGAAEEAAEDASAAGEELPLPEEDLQGVEIEVTPAGKDPKRLSLLSGGEKSMTALAFLFAVFLARPCPFYILDEVEAALDDHNIDRFLGLLRRYCTRAQFIVVTHQKRTMEAADALYGVSMGDDGISKVISRRLDQPPAELAA